MLGKFDEFANVARGQWVKAEKAADAAHAARENG